MLMRKLNKAVWRLTFLISAIPACMVSYWLFGIMLTVFPFEYLVDLNDEYLGLDMFWLQFTPVVIGCLGFLVNSLTSMSEVFDLVPEPSDPVEFPVPFIGISKGVFEMFRTMLVITGWMGIFCILLITIPLCLPGFIVSALSVMFAVPVLAAIDAIYFAAVYIAKAIDRRQYDRNTVCFVCPECGKKSPRPAYDIGGLWVRGLCPGIKGVLSVEMETSDSPCFGSKGGRKDLTQSCPECGSLVATKEGRPLVVSIAGARSSGKTSFVMSVTGGLISSSGNGNAASVRNYHFEHDSELLDYRSGLCRPTPDSDWKPHLAIIDSAKFVTCRNLYLFDVSGKFFTGAVETDLQPQYAFNDAIVFALDPTCSDPAGVAASAYIGFIEKYRQFNRMDASERISVPLSVVVTRADKGGPLSGLDGKDLRDNMAEGGYYNLINMMERDFSSVSFFSCATNREDGSSSRVMKHICDATGSEFGQFFKG